MPARRAKRTISTVILVLCGVTMILPFAWLLASALKTRAELVAVPPVWIPKAPQWGNFVAVIGEVPLFAYYLNSLIVAGGISFSVLMTSAMAGFALAKYDFRGRDVVFKGILATMMLPSFIFIIPVYYMMRRVPLAGGNDWLGLGGYGLLHSHLSMILPFAVSAWGVFLMRQFMLGIPDSLLDAARIDGASEGRIFWNIILPLTKPALATVGIFTFISQWNNLFWPLVIATSAPELTTLTVGLKMLAIAFDPNRNSHLILAGLTLGILPVTFLFASLQRYYVKGIAMTGIKD
ncbi:MAG: carbohydrate ABC transporter permease [Firmicutes bacterium]|nr:carbohydrate ABC transporter permease [Bacillota bacterium]